MSILTNISREYILKAIEKIDTNPELKTKRSSSTYDLIYGEKKYPPILVLSIANQLNNGKELLLSDFDNNIEKPFKHLRDNGFEIIEKEEAYNIEEKDFIDKINNFTTNVWLVPFLDLLKSVIEKSKLKIDDELISFTLYSQKKRISINIGNRIAIAIEQIKGNHLLILCIKEDDIQLARKQKTYLKDDKSDYFDTIPKGSLLYFECIEETFLNKELIAAFHRGLEEFIPLAIKSPQSKRHNPFIYKAAVDLDYRNNLISQLHNSIQKMTEQVMVYEVKASASKNAEILTSKNKSYFYWNNTTYKNLVIGDFVFVVNSSGKKVLFTKLDRINIEIESTPDGNTFFSDENQLFTVSGKWGAFIRLHIIKTIETPTEWKWKSLGSSETTYLNGNRVNKDKGENRVLNIQQLKQLSDDIEFNRVLDSCLLNFTNSNDILIPEIDAAIKPNTTSISTDFHTKTNAAGLFFSQLLIKRYIASLATKPFIIFTGLSGSGKTKLAQTFAKWISIDDSQYSIIPVGADWTNREPLLGYPNGLDSKKYVLPDNGALNLIFNAIENAKDKGLSACSPYFLILDEMNLSHVERYFADFLSAMESQEPISLYSGGDRLDENNRLIPKEILLPKNLFIVGTVNIDETTYMFSPKVLDRANTIEFRVDKNDLETFFDAENNISQEAINGKGQLFTSEFMTLVSIETVVNEKFHIDLLNFFEALQPVGAEFGYRTANEMNRLIYQLDVLGLERDEKSLDVAVMQKLLPKLHGSRTKLNKVLPVLASFCIKDQKLETAKTFLEEKYREGQLKKENINQLTLPLSFAKIARMYCSAQENGFASYAEG